MGITVKQIESQQAWEEFIRQFFPNNFLQSWQFGQFNLGMGDEPLYLGVFEQDEQIASALFIKTYARRGNYYACAAGPLVVGIGNNLSNGDASDSGQQKSEFLISKSEITPKADPPNSNGQDMWRTNPNDQNTKYKIVVKYLIEFLKKQNDAVFVRIRPAVLQTDENQKFFAEMGFRPAPMHLHAERTWVLDITPSEDDLMKGMRKNTRYYVRRASKDGVEVRTSTKSEDVKILYDLQKETVERHGFVPFSLNYFEGLMRSFGPHPNPLPQSGEGSPLEADRVRAVLFIASYKGEDIGCAMINYYGDQAVYHYAATDSTHAKLPSAYLILWEAIKEAKKRGCKYFNFWGVVGDEEKDHPWFGLSRFKKGFGGEEVRYLHAHDYPLSWKYWITWGVEKVRKWRRGL